MLRVYGGLCFFVGPTLYPVSRVLFTGRARSSNFCDFFLSERFDANKRISGCTHPNEFVELGLDGCAIPVLCILNYENHQKCNDSGAGIDDQLPSV